MPAPSEIFWIRFKPLKRISTTKISGSSTAVLFEKHCSTSNLLLYHLFSKSMASATRRLQKWSLRSRTLVKSSTKQLIKSTRKFNALWTESSKSLRRRPRKIPPKRRPRNRRVRVDLEDTLEHSREPLRLGALPLLVFSTVWSLPCPLLRW